MSHIYNFKLNNGETFTEAWDRYLGIKRKCPHHGFSDLELVKAFWKALPRELRKNGSHFYKDGNVMDCTGEQILQIFRDYVEESKIFNTDREYHAPSGNAEHKGIN